MSEFDVAWVPSAKTCTDEANPESRETSWGPSNEDIFLLDGTFKISGPRISLKRAGAQGDWLEGKIADRGARGLLCTFKWI